MWRKIGAGLLITGAIAAGGKLAWDGVNEGWFYRLCDKSYAAVRDNAPEDVRNFIEKHPVYTAGLEGLAAGFAAGAAAGASAAVYRLHRKKTDGE